ncbi:MAG TPA: TlpA family protein disulfide reductase, partial [Chromatiales bacterium]|nr:TlpA family protein disulfide reductase [Chromatiales bacterium]
MEAQHPRAILLWLPSEHGVQDGQRRVAEALAGHGIETWLADPFAAWMLPVGESSLRELPVDGLAQAIESAAVGAGAPLVLASHDRGSVPALEALRRWQQAHPGDARVRGALLVTPNLYLQTPEPGQPARMTPAARQTNLPLFLIQPELSTTALRLPAMLEALGQGGARIYWRGVTEARDRFFFRPDATAEELAQAQRLPEWMAQGVERLL